jgi:hypothetical protein
MAIQTYRVFPLPEGWAIQEPEVMRGPYHRLELAVQLALAQFNLARARGRPAEVLVEEEGGRVVFRLPSGRSNQTSKTSS